MDVTASACMNARVYEPTVRVCLYVCVCVWWYWNPGSEIEFTPTPEFHPAAEQLQINTSWWVVFHTHFIKHTLCAKYITESEMHFLRADICPLKVIFYLWEHMLFLNKAHCVKHIQHSQKKRYCNWGGTVRYKSLKVLTCILKVLIFTI